MNQDKTIMFCPKCKSENTNTTKAKQPDGTMIENIIKVQILGTDMQSGVSTPVKGATIGYHSYVCGDCMTMFAIADITPKRIIMDGGE